MFNFQVPHYQLNKKFNNAEKEFSFRISSHFNLIDDSLFRILGNRYSAYRLDSCYEKGIYSVFHFSLKQFFNEQAIVSQCFF